MNWKVVCGLSLSILSSACIRIYNLTPKEFPLVVSDYLTDTEIQATIGTNRGIEPYLPLIQVPEENRIMAVARNRFGFPVNDLHVVVDGLSHTMAPLGPPGYFYYVPEETCRADYTFKFRANTTYSSEYRVDVTKFGNVIWFEPGLRAHTLSDNDGAYVDINMSSHIREKRIILRNLQADQVDIQAIQFSQGIPNPDSSKFELMELPSFPVTLSCGQSISFRVKWNQQGGVLGDTSDTTWIDVIGSSLMGTIKIVGENQGG